MSADRRGAAPRQAIAAADAAFWQARATALGADGAAPLSAAAVEVAEWARLKCSYGCPDHGRRRTCPPFSPSAAEFRAVLAGYESTLLLWVEAGDDLTAERRRLHEATLAVEREAFLSGLHKAFALLEGACLWCTDDEPCAPQACRHPELVRPSLSGCGVDVFATAAAAGVTLRVARARGDSFRLLGLVLLA